MTIKKSKNLFVKLYALVFLCLIVQISFAKGDNAAPTDNNSISLPYWYFGGAVGFGTTTWENLVNTDPLVDITALYNVDEGGIVWGFFSGFQLTKHIAIEGQYNKFPNAKLFFAPESIYTSTYKIKNLTTSTDAYSMIAKFMLPVYSTGMNIYSDFGASFVHRSDRLARTHWRIGPTFGLGLNYIYHRRWLIEIAGQYYTGYGKTELEPVFDFVPFLYSVQLKLAYVIS